MNWQAIMNKSLSSPLLAFSKSWCKFAMYPGVFKSSCNGFKILSGISTILLFDEYLIPEESD